MDVVSPESVSRGLSRALEKLGGSIDMLVNNAGYAIPGYIDQFDERTCQEMLDVNYLGAVRVVRRRAARIQQAPGIASTRGPTSSGCSRSAVCSSSD